MSIEKVAILGGGLMGSGIAESVASAGIAVVVRDVDATAVDAARRRIGTSLDRAAARGKLDADQIVAIHDRIELTADLEAIGDADLVIEAVPENAELKANILSQVAGLVSEDALIASNTSSIPIAQLAAGLPRPERVLGLHFFSPVPVMRLVEIVVALDTSEDAVAAARDFAERIGKRAIVTKDRSGFIVNMLLVPYLMAAVRMYEEEFASAEDIDEGMKLGCGHPMGPLTLADFIGLDVCLDILYVLYDGFKDPKYRPCPLLVKMVQAGKLGRKTGEGFYKY